MLNVLLCRSTVMRKELKREEGQIRSVQLTDL
jgi:hypothetical protein